VVANVGLGLGGFAGGLIAAGPGFTALFLLNAVTFVAYGLVIRTIPDARPRRGSRAGSYREVARDRAFVRLAAINFAFVAGAVSLLNGLFPVFAVSEAGVGTATVGVLFLLNSLVIVVLQIPAARLQQGRRRMVALAQMGALFAMSWLLVLAAGLTEQAAVQLLVAGIVLFSLAECLYDSVQGPLTADLAGDRLTGRYMAVSGFSWQLGFVVGPAAGAALMGVRRRWLCGRPPPRCACSREALRSGSSGASRSMLGEHRSGLGPGPPRREAAARAGPNAEERPPQIVSA
jgi:hypothetical protein